MSYDKIYPPVGTHAGRAGLPGFNGLAPAAGPNGCNGRPGRPGIQGQMSPNPDNGNNGMNGINQQPLPNSDNSDNGIDAPDGKLVCFESWHTSSIPGLWNSSHPSITTQPFFRSTFLPDNNGIFGVDTAGMYEFTLKLVTGAITLLINGSAVASVSTDDVYAETQYAAQLAIGDNITFFMTTTTTGGIIINMV